MCGIVGYTGPKDCSDILVETLKKLEYRGYDSAGIAVFEDGEIKTAKTKGRLKDLENKMKIEGKPVGNVGIGHTRWATHGEPSDVNSHPHSGRRVTVVHNGIIENADDLKEFLIDNGQKFKSDTDTEVVAQLLDYYYKGNPLECIVNTLNDLTGSFALGIIFEDYKDKIFAVRRESPLIVGTSKNENFIASDVTAILNYTKNYYILDNDEIAEITNENIKFFNKHLEKIEKEINIAKWDADAADKKGYPHFMIKEIYEQPEAIKTTLKPNIKNGLPNLSYCGLTSEKLKNYNQIYIVACGTAMHAGMLGKYVIEKLARVPVVVDIASEFRYRNPLVKEGDLVIIISQSGETADSIAAMRLAKNLGAETLAIVNAQGTTMSREADMLISTNAGPEIAVASTKAYLVQIATMYILAFKLSLAKGTIDEKECKRLISVLESTPEYIKKSIDSNIDVCQYISTTLIYTEHLLYIGRGLDYALSMEGSLKIKETSYIHSESYTAGELKHGTMSIVTDGMPVVALATQTDLMEKIINNVKELKARGATVTLVCNDEFKLKDGIADYVIRVPKIDDILMPIVTVMPLQLLAYYTSVNKGNDVDKPRNLAKAVTVE